MVCLSSVVVVCCLLFDVCVLSVCCLRVLCNVLRVIGVCGVLCVMRCCVCVVISWLVFAVVCCLLWID